MSEDIITQKQFAELINESLNDWTADSESELNVDGSPWTSDPTRWEKVFEYARAYFFRKIAKKHASYLGNNLSQAVDDLGFTFMAALVNLRKNKAANPAMIYSYSYIVSVVENALKREERSWARHRREVSIEDIVEPGIGQPDPPIIDELLSAFIKTISDIQRNGSNPKSLMYWRIYLAKFIIDSVKQFPDLYSSKGAQHHERETANQLEHQFVLFCMQNKTIQYNTFASISENKLGKYHDMTAETEGLRPYSEYVPNQDIEPPIVYKVVSSYLYSVGVKGKDHVQAVAENTISEYFNKIKRLLRTEIER